MPAELNLTEPPRERKQIDCVEIYLPKTIEFLAELYQFLRETVKSRRGSIALNGFSVYEVDGVFRGEQTWEQRTLVVRLLLFRPAGHPAPPWERTIDELGRELATRIAVNEEQIWICRYPPDLTVFQGVKRILT